MLIIHLYLIKNMKKLANKDLEAKYGMFYENIDTSRKLALAAFPLFLARRSLFIFLIVTFDGHSIVQW